MADEDKQFEASPQKLKKLRDEGQWYKSQDLTAALVLIGLFSLLFAMAPVVWNELSALFILLFEQIPNATLEKIGWQYVVVLVLKTFAVTLVPFFVLAVILGIIVNVLQVGPMFSTKTLEPKFDKLNPVNGIKGMFTMQKVVELLKNILKILVLGYVGYLVFQEFLPRLLLTGSTENIFAIMSVIGALLFKFVMMAGIAFAILGAADCLYQRLTFMKKQKMSFKEMKDEFKNSEGDPHVKQALRQRRMQMMMQRMQNAVPTADVVVTNPIHVAVALKYNPESEAPTVVAKGAELFAQRIKEIAEQYDVPVVENPPIARSLYKLVDIDGVIPANLYQAVAEILLFAWNLKGVPVPVEPAEAS